MKTFIFQCKKCGFSFEEVDSSSKIPCPECGGSCRKVNSEPFNNAKSKSKRRSKQDNIEDYFSEEEEKE